MRFFLKSIFFLFVFLTIGCLDEDLDNFSNDINLETHIAIPLISSTSMLNDFLPEDENLSVEVDNSIKIMYQQDSIAYVESDKFLTIDNQEPTTESFEIGTIELPNVSDTQVITLEELSQQLTDPILSENIANAFVLAESFGGLAWFPPIPPQSGGIYNQTVSNQFMNIDIVSGSLSINLTNNLGVLINNLILKLKNQSDSDYFGELNFSNISPGESIIQTISLDNKTMYNNISFEVVEIFIEGSGLESSILDPDVVLLPISIDDNISIDIQGDGFQVDHGIVIIPEIENGPSDSFTFDFELDDDIEVTEIELLSGNIKFEYQSNINAILNLTLNIPQLISPNGSQYTTNISIENTGFNSVINIDDLSGYRFDFSQNTNAISVSYYTEIQSSPNFTTYDYTDSVRLSIGIQDIDFSYVQGFFGQQIESIDEDVLDIDVSVIDNIVSGIILESPILRFIVNNSIDIPFQIDLELLGSNQGQVVNLNGPAMDIPANALSIHEFDNTNSQLSDLISITPSVISYSGSVITNPNNGGLVLNTILPETAISIGFEMDLPLHIRIEDGILNDTIPLSLSDNDPRADGLEFEKVKIKLHIENEFPLDLSLSILFTDSLSGNILDSLYVDLLEAAPVDQIGRTISAKTYDTLIELDTTQIEALFNSNQALIQASMNSFDYENTAIRLYTDYKFIIDVGLIVELKIE